jgi:hypothetical protein
VLPEVDYAAGASVEEEASEEDSAGVALAVVLAVISPTKNCMLITMGLIPQVVQVDLEAV